MEDIAGIYINFESTYNGELLKYGSEQQEAARLPPLSLILLTDSDKTS